MALGKCRRGRGRDFSVIGVDLLAAAAVGYLVRKARRVGGRADEAVDEILDAGTDRVCALVTAALGDEPVLAQLDTQARGGTETDRTVRRAEDAIADKLETDAGFAEQLEQLLRQLEKVPGGISLSAPGGVAAGRDVNIRAEGGGIAAGVMGPVTVNPPEPGPNQA
jgi:hypothetical protein